jgi:hypothetical protein
MRRILLIGALLAVFFSTLIVFSPVSSADSVVYDEMQKPFAHKGESQESATIARAFVRPLWKESTLQN